MTSCFGEQTVTASGDQSEISSIILDSKTPPTPIKNDPNN
jgi:hypothetical protein